MKTKQGSSPILIQLKNKEDRHSDFVNLTMKVWIQHF